MQKILFVITCSALFITCAFGQRTLTLEECLALAQKNSPALQAAEGELHSTQLADAELSTTALPQVKAAGGASYAPMPPGFGYDPAISNGGQLAAQVIVEQSIYD